MLQAGRFSFNVPFQSRRLRLTTWGRKPLAECPSVPPSWPSGWVIRTWSKKRPFSWAGDVLKLTHTWAISHIGCFRHSFCPGDCHWFPGSRHLSLFSMLPPSRKKKKRIIYFLVLEAETWGHRTVTCRHCRKKKSQDWKILSLCACWAGPSAELILFGSVLSLIYLKNGKQSCIYLTLREVWISTLWNETVHKVWHWGVIPGHPNSTIWSFDHLTALCETHAWSSRSGLQVISEKLVFEKLVFSVLSMRWKLFKQERV